MILPDARCEKHGAAEMSANVRKRDGIKKYRCLACFRDTKRYRNRSVKPRGVIRSYGQDRCVNAHLKTPWTWREYGGHFRCMTCQYTREKRRRAGG